MRVLVPMILLAASVASVFAQSESKLQIDPNTGRAIGAKEISPQELQSLIDRKSRMLIIDVRDAADFDKETIRGAVHIPMEELPKRLKDIPKDTILAFT